MYEACGPFPALLDGLELTAGDIPGQSHPRVTSYRAAVTRLGVRTVSKKLISVVLAAVGRVLTRERFEIPEGRAVEATRFISRLEPPSCTPGGKGNLRRQEFGADIVLDGK